MTETRGEYGAFGMNGSNEPKKGRGMDKKDFDGDYGARSVHIRADGSLQVCGIEIVDDDGNPVDEVVVTADDVPELRYGEVIGSQSGRTWRPKRAEAQLLWGMLGPLIREVYK